MYSITLNRNETFGFTIHRRRRGEKTQTEYNVSNERKVRVHYSNEMWDLFAAWCGHRRSTSRRIYTLTYASHDSNFFFSLSLSSSISVNCLHALNLPSSIFNAKWILYKWYCTHFGTAMIKTQSKSNGLRIFYKFFSLLRVSVCLILNFIKSSRVQWEFLRNYVFRKLYAVCMV